MRYRWLLGAILFACLALVTACGGGESPEPTEPTPEPTPEPTVAAFTVDDVVWTSGVDEASGEPLDEVDAYTTVSPAIVAVVPAANVPAGTEFTATWTIDGIEVPEATMSVTVDEDMRVAWVAFELARDEGRYFPLGELEVTVTTSTGDEVAGSVRIELP